MTKSKTTEISRTKSIFNGLKFSSVVVAWALLFSLSVGALALGERWEHLYGLVGVVLCLSFIIWLHQDDENSSEEKKRIALECILAHYEGNEEPEPWQEELIKVCKDAL